MVDFKESQELLLVPLVVAVAAHIGTLALALFFNASGEILILSNGGARFHVRELGTIFYKSQAHRITRCSTSFLGTR